LGRSLEKNIIIRQDLKAPYSLVLGDPGQIEHVLLNLAINARDAMPAGGELSIATELVFLDENYCQTHTVTMQDNTFCLC